MAAEITFWFEFASTYSYLAAERLAGTEAPADVVVTWKPVLLGPVFAAQGWDTSPFLVYPAKGRYMWRDMERLCAEAGIPFVRPSIFPQNSVLAARVACLGEGQAWLPSFVRGIYRANFAEDRDISDPAVIASVLSAQGLDAGALLAAAQAPENRPRLRANVAEAEALGLFGAPTFTVGKEVFWGNDRLDHAAAWARGTARRPCREEADAGLPSRAQP